MIVKEDGPLLAIWNGNPGEVFSIVLLTVEYVDVEFGQNRLKIPMCLIFCGLFWQIPYENFYNNKLN